MIMPCPVFALDLLQYRISPVDQPVYSISTYHKHKPLGLIFRMPYKSTNNYLFRKIINYVSLIKIRTENLNFCYIFASILF